MFNWVVNRNVGSRLVEGLELAQEIDDLTLNAYSLIRAQQLTLSIEQDSIPSSPYGNLTDGVHIELITVPADAEHLVAETFNSVVLEHSALRADFKTSPLD